MLEDSEDYRTHFPPKGETSGVQHRRKSDTLDKYENGGGTVLTGTTNPRSDKSKSPQPSYSTCSGVRKTVQIGLRGT